MLNLAVCFTLLAEGCFFLKLRRGLHIPVDTFGKNDVMNTSVTKKIQIFALTQWTTIHIDSHRYMAMPFLGSESKIHGLKQSDFIADLSIAVTVAIKSLKDFNVFIFKRKNR